jgi:hypothetical protein
VKILQLNTNIHELQPGAKTIAYLVSGVTHKHYNRLERLTTVTLAYYEHLQIKARGLLKSGAPERCFTRIASGHTHKHYKRLGRLTTVTLAYYEHL